MSEATVYLPQEPVGRRVDGKIIPKDLSGATQYGKIVPILQADEAANAPPAQLARKMQESLSNFSAPRDYICMAGGDFLSLAIALLALRSLGWNYVNVLRWNREIDSEGNKTGRGYYMPVSVPLSGAGRE